MDKPYDHVLEYLSLLDDSGAVLKQQNQRLSSPLTGPADVPKKQYSNTTSGGAAAVFLQPAPHQGSHHDHHRRHSVTDFIDDTSSRHLKAKQPVTTSEPPISERGGAGPSTFKKLYRLGGEDYMLFKLP